MANYTLKCQNHSLSAHKHFCVLPAPPAVATFAPEEKHKAMKTFITSIALMMLLTAIPAAAQDITVAGKVTDTRREPVPFASVVLRSLPDSAVVAGSMTTTEASRSALQRAAATCSRYHSSATCHTSRFAERPPTSGTSSSKMTCRCLRRP